MPYTNIRTAKDAANKIAVVELYRPEALNAMTVEMTAELIEALESLDADSDINAIVLTGNEKTFSAGSDIKRITDADTVELFLEDRYEKWNRIRRIRKPLIAAVSGFVLGGGCELMMICDIVVASETAKFSQPEISIGVIPAAGGTQRLTRTLGKGQSMEMILTGKTIDAREALRLGLVNKIVAKEVFLDEAKKLAKEIASKPPIAVRLAKESILKVYDGSLDNGLDFERKSFYLLFATEDMREGMKAFVVKRKPTWKGR